MPALCVTGTEILSLLPLLERLQDREGVLIFVGLGIEVDYADINDAVSARLEKATKEEVTALSGGGAGEGLGGRCGRVGRGAGTCSWWDWWGAGLGGWQRWEDKGFIPGGASTSGFTVEVTEVIAELVVASDD